MLVLQHFTLDSGFCLICFLFSLFLSSIDRYFIRTSNTEHPEDRLIDARVEILPVNSVQQKTDHLELTKDGYYVIGGFKVMNGMANGFVPHVYSPVKQMRISITADSDRWVIINEVFPIERKNNFSENCFFPNFFQKNF